jgi:hypothetical protein
MQEISETMPPKLLNTSKSEKYKDGKFDEEAEKLKLSEAEAQF